MQIIIHRVNTIEQLQKIPKEYGVEIDIRAYNNKLILNHEPFQDGDELEEYLKNYGHSFIIFNIKEAGIENQVIQLARKYNIKDYFLLDVEFPFIYRATRKGFKNIAIRFSESEPIELALAQVKDNKPLADWIWADTNTKNFVHPQHLANLKIAGFKICIICPSRWARPEDIPVYISYLKENDMELDAVMTSLEHADLWK